MNTSIENVAKFLASAIMADGNYDKAEKIALEEIADVMKFNAEELIANVETEVKCIKGLNEKKLKETLCVASTEVAENENVIIFESLLELVLVDGILTTTEVETLLEAADLLAIPQAEAVLMLADMVKEEPEMNINL